MSKINAIHVVLLIAVFIFNNQQRKIVNKGKVDRSDIIRNSTSDFEISFLIPILFLLLPIYYLLTHEKVNSEIIEKIIIMITYVFSTRTVQNMLNPNYNNALNVTIPLVTLILLNGIFSNLIGKNYTKHVYVYIMMMSFIHLKSNPNETSTSIMNDIILSHFVFYCNK